MSVPSIEFIKTDDFNVKEECDIELEFVKQMETTGVGLLGDLENRTKCGEVFISDEKTFILICSICDGLYVSMLDFGEHYMLQHLKEEETVHELEIDEETLEPNNGKPLTPEPLEVLAKEPLMSVELLEETKDSVINEIAETLPEIQVQKAEVEDDGDDQNENNDNLANDLDYLEDDSDVGSGSDYKPIRRKYMRTTQSSDPRLFCELCQRQYKSAITFGRHVTKMHDENKRKLCSLKCRYCDREFSTEKELNEHKNTHDRLRPFQCPQCPKSFTSSNHRQKHIDMHMGVRPYKCSKCPSAFGTECDLHQHMLKHALAGPFSETKDPAINAIAETLPEIQVQKAEVEDDGDDKNENDENFANDLDYSEDDSDVGSGSDYKPLRRKYMRTTQSSDPQLFCELCQRQYKSAITFGRHVTKMHDENKRKPCSLKCRYCDREFSSEKELNEHKNTHDRLRPFQCPQCPKSFTSSNHRQKHINMHMGVRPYKCSKCPSAFGTECNLRQHMLTHAVAGPLSCDICGKQFIHQSRKDVHMRSHTGEKPFQCELCGRKFIIRSRLTEHMKRHNNTRNHECEICGKKFYTNVMLKHHQVAHSSDRPFECNECGKTFPRKLSLKMHRKIHSEVKQYSCNICGKEFRQYAGLYAHRKSHGEKKGLPQTNIAISDKFTPPTHLLVVRDEDPANDAT